MLLLLIITQYALPLSYLPHGNRYPHTWPFPGPEPANVEATPNPFRLKSIEIYTYAISVYLLNDIYLCVLWALNFATLLGTLAGYASFILNGFRCNEVNTKFNIGLVFEVLNKTNRYVLLFDSRPLSRRHKNPCTDAAAARNAVWPRIRIEENLSHVRRFSRTRWH